MEEKSNFFSILNDKNITLDTETAQKGSAQPMSLLSTKQFASLVKNRIFYHVVVKPTGNDDVEKQPHIWKGVYTTEKCTQKEISQRKLENVLETYAVVFPEELLGELPLERGVKMTINLEKDANPKMEPVYKLSHVERKGMKNKLMSY